MILRAITDWEALSEIHLGKKKKGGRRGEKKGERPSGVILSVGLDSTFALLKKKRRGERKRGEGVKKRGLGVDHDVIELTPVDIPPTKKRGKGEEGRKGGAAAHQGSPFLADG